MADLIPQKILDKHKFQQEMELISALQKAADFGGNLKVLEETLVQIFTLVKKMNTAQWKCFKSQRKNIDLLRLAMEVPASVDMSKIPMFKMDYEDEETKLIIEQKVNIFDSLGQGCLIRLNNPRATMQEYFSIRSFKRAIENYFTIITNNSVSISIEKKDLALSDKVIDVEEDRDKIAPLTCNWDKLTQETQDKYIDYLQRFKPVERVRKCIDLFSNVSMDNRFMAIACALSVSRFKSLKKDAGLTRQYNTSN